MALGDSRLGVWQVLLTISVVIIPLSVNGSRSLATASRRHHHHNNQSSVDKEAFGTGTVLSDDSAETDRLIGGGLGLGARLPLGAANHQRSHNKPARLDFSEEDLPAGGGEELTAGGAGPDQPSNPLSDEVITVEFHSPAPDAAPSSDALSRDRAEAPARPLRQKAGDPTAWTLSDFYDYLSPDDDDPSSALDATAAPEPSPSPPADMEDENPLLAGSPEDDDAATPALPPEAAPGPEDRGRGLGLGSGAEGPGGCRPGFVPSGLGVCVSRCDADPNFCFNGGVCTVAAGMDAFCRCNVQEYIWNKGSRCDWVVTEFQVMCLVVGVASAVLVLLFMIIVFFAKRLHRLKKENKRLRKRSKYRPQSGEPQTDGFSVSTTADVSQPNVRNLCDTPPPPPQAHAHNLAYYDNIICQDEPQKQEEPVKSPPPKEEESMNIRNSHSPKQENNRPASVDHDNGHAPNNTEEKEEVNSLQNNLV